MIEFSEADVQAWEARAGRVWTLYLAGERRTDALAGLLEPDDQVREELVEDMFRAAATGDLDAMWAIGRVAIAGCGGPVGPDEGWFFVESCADEGWEPAVELVERRATLD